MKKILFLTAVLFCWCGTASERQISGAEMLEMRLESSEMLTLPEETFLKLIITNMSMLFIFIIIQLMQKKGSELYKFFTFPLAALLIYTNIYG